MRMTLTMKIVTVGSGNAPQQDLVVFEKFAHCDFLLGFRFYKQDFGPELLGWRFLLLRTVCHNNALVLFFQGNARFA